MSTLLLIWLMSSLPAADAAPDLHFVTLTDVTDLSPPTTMLQDHQGFIWMASYSGLYRYDGYQSRHFKHQPNTPGSLPHDTVTAVFEDQLHRLWVSTLGGLALFEAETGTFKTYFPLPEQGDAAQNRQIRKIASDGGTGLWLATRQGLQHFDPDTGQFRIYRHDPAQQDSLFRDNVDTLVLDQQGGLWLATWPGGLDYLPKGSSQFQHFQTTDKNLPLAKNVRSLFFDSRQRLWMGTEAGIFVWQSGSNWADKKPLPTPGNQGQFRVHAFIEDSSGTVWAATVGGLLRWDQAQQRFDHYQHRLEDSNSLVGNHALSMLLDRSGSFWVATKAGISRVDLSLTGFDHFLLKPLTSADGNADKELTAITSAGLDRLWLGGRSKLLLVNTKTRQLIKSLTPKKDGLPDTIIYNLYQQPNGILWIGTRSGLVRFDVLQQRFKLIDLGNDGSNYINKIAQGIDGTLWMATGGGLIEYDPAGGIVRKFQHDPGDPQSITNNSVGMLMVDRSGKVWSSGGRNAGGGLDVLDTATGKFQHYISNPDDPESLPSNFVASAQEDPHGTVWLVSMGGLSKVKNAIDGSLSFNNYNSLNGLSAEYITAINIDKTGRLWLNTSADLTRFDPASSRFTEYRHRQGYGMDWIFGASLLDSDGTLYCNGSTGLTVVHPEQVKDNQLAPLLAITDISILNHSLAEGYKVDGVKLDGSVTEPKSLSLPWYQSVFSLKFSALHYADPSRNRYAYKLEGFDQDWVETDSTIRIATYTNLNPGHYLFRVKASNNTGLWNETGISLPITIIPPYWQTLWFRAIVGLSLLALLICGYYLRIRQLNENQANLERQVAQRTEELQDMTQKALVTVQIKREFLANMSHEIRTPMNAIMGMAHLTMLTELTPKQHNYLTKINTSAKWLLGILNDILDFSKIEAGKLQLERTEFRLESILQYLEDVSLPLLEGKPLALNFEIAPAVPTALLGDALRLGQVLLNLLSNAIKFTQTGSISVQVALQHSDGHQACLSFSVTDTGIGLSKEQQSGLFTAFTQADNSTTRLYGGTGLGLAISKDLVEAMGGTIGIESSLGVGSCFYFTATFGVAVQSQLQPELVPVLIPSSDKYPTLRNAYVLLVEDNLINQEFMPEILGHEGIRVDLAGNGEEALELIGRNDYSAVLMDCQMPVMDGFETTKRIRSDPRFATLPIIAMTGNVMAEDRERCLSSGMNDHIGKPIDWELFFQTLERWISPQITVNRVEVVAKQAEAVPAFPQLTGVDLAIVQKQIGNNVVLYRKMLTLFSANHKDDIAQIRAAQLAGDYEAAVQVAHKFKGSASSMAQTPLSSLTAELEQALIQRDLAALETLLTKTGAVLNRLITEIKQLEKSSEGLSTLDQLMLDMSSLLANASFITDEALTQLNKLLPEAHQATYRTLVRHTLATDYPEAQAILNTLIRLAPVYPATAPQDLRPVVLVVDDTRVNQEILVALLSHDYRVKVAGNGQRALAITQDFPPPDLVLLDINMPKMDGYEVCQKLQDDPLTRDIPVIFVTAASDLKSETQGLRLGAVDYITKPIVPATTLLRVRNQVLSKQHEKQLQHIAHYDNLTSIPNRVLLADRMKQAIAQSKREQTMLAVCYLDLDGFKFINDTLGHQAGDQVLIETASRIGGMLRETDTVARLGGDEFVVLLPNLHQQQECIATLNRLLETIALPIYIQDQACLVTASIGVSLFPSDDSEPDLLLRHADQAMYIAKQSGKNRYHLFDLKRDLQTRAYHETLLRIQQGLDSQEFELYYQPVVNLSNRKLLGVEALLRWHHPERGLLLPGDFLNDIHNTELEISLGVWVIDTALAQLAQWQETGFALNVSVNIAACQLQAEGFVDHLKRSFASYPSLPPGCLHIELLETAALDDFSVVSDTMEACRLLGVEFALDDFGTGYSSLTYLHRLPVATLKIDQSFIRDMQEGKSDKAMVQGIIALAKAYGLKTVAEGIETMEQFEALLAMGCECGQGYVIARPMSAADFMANYSKLIADELTLNSIADSNA